MTLQRGDVVLVPFPFAYLSSAKNRPAVVVSSALFHQTEPDIIVAAITSQIGSHRGPIDTLLADWRHTGLLKPSVVKSSLATLEMRMVRHTIGKLSSADLATLSRNLAAALDLNP